MLVFRLLMAFERYDGRDGNCWVICNVSSKPQMAEAPRSERHATIAGVPHGFS